MAIRFLNALNIDGTITATVNADSDSTYTGIVVSESGLLKYRTKSQIRSDIGAGTMSSFTLAASSGSNSTISGGDTMTLVAGSGITTVNNGSGSVTITATASGYSGWTLAGDSGSSQSIASGNTATFAGGTKISTVASATDTLTINHDSTSRSDTTSTDTLGSGGSFTKVDSVTTDATGHVTAINVETVTIGSFDNYGSWTLAGDSGSSQTISSGNTATIAGGTGLSSVAGSTDTVTINLDDTSVTAGSYTSANITVNAQGQITAASDGGAGTMTSWTLAGSSGTNQTITNGNTATFAQGNGITTVGSATDTLTITNSKPFDSITLASTTGSDSTITNSDTITIAAGANITTTNNGSGQVTIAYTGGTGSMSSFFLAGDSGSTQTITNGNTVSILGSAGIDTLAGALADAVVVQLDLSELTTVTSIDPAADFLVGVDGTANEKILYEDVHLNQWGDAEADVDFGGNKLLDVANGTNSSDGVNLGQVQSLVAGVGLFKGGYNANTGNTVNLSPNGSLDGASNIALDGGDFFAVTVGGTAFFTETLEPGDMIYAVSDIAASSNPSISEYTVVKQDDNVAGAGATDGATQKGVAGFDSGNFGVTANGFVTLDNTGVSAGSYGSASKSLSATVTAKGLLTSLSEQNISITASQVSDFCNAVSTCIAANEQYTVNIGDGNATSYAVTHNLGTRDVMVQLYDNSSYDTVYADITRNSTSQVTIAFTTAPSTNDIRVLITKVA